MLDPGTDKFISDMTMRELRSMVLRFWWVNQLKINVGANIRDSDLESCKAVQRSTARRFRDLREQGHAVR